MCGGLLDDWTNGCSADFFFTYDMVLVFWRVGPILGNGYGIKGRNYVALLQGSEISAELQFRNLILGG